jgi:hypothetical protein
MSLENAILELAKSITFHAEVLREVNQPINIQQEAKSNDVSFEAPKAPKKSKKSDSVVSVDPAKPGADETVMRYSDPVEAKVEVTISNPPKAVEAHEEVKVGNVVIKSADTITSEMCKNLAKEKMGAGVDRTKIKGLVTEMGAESIADLTDRNLVEFYIKLQALK